MMPLLGIYLILHWALHRDTCISLFVVVIDIIAKVRIEPRCPSTDEKIKKIIYTQWSLTHPIRTERSCHLQENVWN